jgi:uncharacterized glyoxalase superfamily protein PhnB
MSQSQRVPEGKAVITPHIVVDGAADAIEFYKKAFGAVELCRMAGPSGDRLMHAAVTIGGATVMLVDEAPQWGSFGPKSLNGSPVTLHIEVANVDAFVAQAVEAGATLAMPVADMFWGDRYGQVVDPFGHKWSIATHIRDLTPAEMEAAGKEAFAKMQPCGELAEATA